MSSKTQPHPWVLASRLLTERPTSTEHEETCRLAAITIRDLYAAAKTSSREQALDVIDKVLEILTNVWALEVRLYQQRRAEAISLAICCVKDFRKRYEKDDPSILLHEKEEHEMTCHQNQNCPKLAPDLTIHEQLHTDGKQVIIVVSAAHPTILGHRLTSCGRCSLNTSERGKQLARAELIDAVLVGYEIWVSRSKEQLDALSYELEKGINSGPPIEPTPEYWEGKKQRLRERFGELKDSGVPSFEEITKLPEEEFRAMMTAFNEKKE